MEKKRLAESSDTPHAPDKPDASVDNQTVEITDENEIPTGDSANTDFDTNVLEMRPGYPEEPPDEEQQPPSRGGGTRATRP
eukprot:2604084-Prymnesium_polylepis.1